MNNQGLKKDISEKLKQYAPNVKGLEGCQWLTIAASGKVIYIDGQEQDSLYAMTIFGKSYYSVMRALDKGVDYICSAILPGGEKKHYKVMGSLAVEENLYKTVPMQVVQGAELGLPTIENGNSVIWSVPSETKDIDGGTVVTVKEETSTNIWWEYKTKYYSRQHIMHDRDVNYKFFGNDYTIKIKWFKFLFWTFYRKISHERMVTVPAGTEYSIVAKGDYTVYFYMFFSKDSAC